MKNLLLLLLILSLFNSCCKDCKDPANPDCSNYDPCFGKTETSADFYTEVQSGNRWFDVDMAENADLWRFRAIDTTADEYLWEVGADKFTTKSFTLSGFPIYKSIPIKLTVKRYKPNTLCFPNDKGIATMTKNIYTESSGNFEYDFKMGTGPKNTTLKTVNGKYRGYNKRAPNHLFNFELKSYYAFYQTDIEWGLYPLTNTPYQSRFDYPIVDIINIPFEGKSLYKSFISPNKYVNITYQKTDIDGVDVLDGIAGGLLAQHLGFYTWEGYATKCDIGKYYSFFKYYIYLDKTDKDKVTMEYWYRDTTTRKIIKDTFIGTRVP